MIELVAIIGSHIFLLIIILRAARLSQVEDEAEAEAKMKGTGN